MLHIYRKPLSLLAEARDLLFHKRTLSQSVAISNRKQSKGALLQENAKAG